MKSHRSACGMVVEFPYAPQPAKKRHSSGRWNPKDICLENVSGFQKNGRRLWLLAFVPHAVRPLPLFLKPRNLPNTSFQRTLESSGQMSGERHLFAPNKNRHSSECWNPKDVCTGNVSGFKKNGRRPWLLAFVPHADCPLDSSVRWNDVQGKMIVFFFAYCSG